MILGSIIPMYQQCISKIKNPNKEQRCFCTQKGSQQNFAQTPLVFV
jgi:hypothetical protein